MSVGYVADAEGENRRNNLGHSVEGRSIGVVWWSLSGGPSYA